ncbi:MAG: DUF559 domain-containing protein [Anaerolineaceae bacterium]|nr:MAG: DUF559 domain-containing protein [Anaerolineaceae bacterium]
MGEMAEGQRGFFCINAPRPKSSTAPANYEKAERTAFLESKGYKVIRFFNHEINENIEEVLQKIQLACQ